VRYREVGRQAGDSCAIAHALAVVGDPWNLLIVRDIAGGHVRFDDLHQELGISRKVLTERLKQLVADGVLSKRQYSEHPPRHEYLLTPAGRGLLPVLVALQNWGGQFVLGDGELTATGRRRSPEAHRVRGLVGSTVPPLKLPTASGALLDPIADTPWTVLYAFPGAYAPADPGYPSGWSEIPGAAGCTVESRRYRDRYPEFAALCASVHGVSTQRPDQLASFADYEGLPVGLFSDTDGHLATALRLPTFRAGGADRLKRLTLVIDAQRTVRAVDYPITDPAGSVQNALDMINALGSRAPRRRKAATR
jgi:DNA-binding HxlR family transcriptional regulator/peroxiredoxin